MKTTIAIPVRDRLLENNPFGIFMGPLKMPSRTDFVDALYRLASRGPDARLGLVKSEDGANWIFDSEQLRENCENMVSDLDVTSSEDLQARTAEVVTQKSKYPVRIYINDTYIIATYEHVLGDASIAFLFIEALIAEACGEDTEWGKVAPAAKPLYSAFKNLFFVKPKNIQAALKSKRYARGATSASTSGKVISENGALAVGMIPTDKVREVTQYARSQKAAFNPAVYSAVVNQLKHYGIDAESVGTTYDLRRYLPEHMTSNSNMVAALPFSDEALSNISVLSAEIDENVKTGLPLLAGAFGVAKETLKGYRSRHSMFLQDSHKAHVVFSGVGVVRSIERLPWDTEKGLPFYGAYVRPGGANEITTNVLKLKNRVFISTCFYADAYDAPTVQKALDELAADPVFYMKKWAGAQEEVSQKA